DNNNSATTPDRVNGAGARVSLTRRGGPGHNRNWARMSLGGLARGRRRDKEPKGLTPRSPTRRMTLGGAMREQGVGAGGHAYKGRHGIRYEQPHPDVWMEELGEGQAATSLPISTSPGRLASPIAEDSVAAVESDKQAAEGRDDTDAEDAGDNDAGTDGHNNSSSVLPTGQGQVPASEAVPLNDICVDTGTSFGAGPPPMGNVSPSSEYRRGSMSPGMPTEGRLRTQSWTAAAAAPSPPVLKGPFSRARSRSRSPRHRVSMTLGPTAGLHLARKPEHNRFSSGGTSVGADRNPVLSDPSIASTGEEGVGLTEGEDDSPAERGDEDEEDKAVGPFTETSLEMARLRLPHMELGFEEDGFFGIDVRSLIIGREIARGAYGVVHEGKLHPSRPRDASVEDGEQAGTTSVSREAGGGAAASIEGEAERDTLRTEATEGEEEIFHDAAQEHGKEEADAAAAEKEEEEKEEASTARSVAVKIQQVPEDEEEQANLLGELAMLRNHKHSHLVEFIGTAMAVERGSDTVMVAMELCTNGALREALKLNIDWPLKVRIASDMTDGLQYLHQHGIIHRDIKTPNVLIDGSWRAKLCDYNFAIDENSSIKQDFCAGTAEFMSPEVLLSEEYGLPSDVFSLGMIFVEMLTGQEPSPSFPERPPQTFFVVSEEEIEGQLLPGYPSSFSLLQSQCLFAEPAERPTAEDAFNWLQDLVNETGEDNIVLPQSGPPLPVLTEGAAIAREGNVINASPKGNEQHWLDTEMMEQQIDVMVENAVERALADRRGQDVGLVGGMAGEDESEAKFEQMKEEMDALRAACDERDSRISELEVQALRNTSTLKMLSSALEVAYKQLMAVSQPDWSSGANGPQADEAASSERGNFSRQEHDDFDAVEARLSQLGPNL
ncbi:unnamed protein product, partial [Ectocarpus fasciculatus]